MDPHVNFYHFGHLVGSAASVLADSQVGNAYTRLFSSDEDDNGSSADGSGRSFRLDYLAAAIVNLIARLVSHEGGSKSPD